MRLTRLGLLLLLAACGSGEGASSDAAGLDTDAPVLTGSIVDRLQQIPGLTVVGERDNPPSGFRVFDLDIDQPQDHAAPEGQHFSQRLQLMHRSDDAPVVLYTSGYNLPGVVLSEPALLVEGNQLAVEHRFFSPSRPADPDWSKLTIEQSAEDFHTIVAAFRLIYPRSKILSTGASKGGMTVVFHRRFFPDDIDGTVAYVAPFSRGAPDPRYLGFVRATGVADCRDKLTAFQREVLTRRTAMAQRMMQNGAHYQVLGYDEALEHFTLEFSFVFWQYDRPSRCDDIPAPTVTDDQLYDFLENGVVNASLTDPSDEGIDDFLPYYYQAAVELGFPQIDEEPLAGLVLYPGTDVAATYTPGLSPEFDGGSAMTDVVTWVSSEGRSLLFVYGEYDPWTAGAMDLGGATDSFRFTVPAGNHGSKISGLSGPDQATAVAAVRRWAGLPETPGKPMPLPRGDELDPLPRMRP